MADRDHTTPPGVPESTCAATGRRTGGRAAAMSLDRRSLLHPDARLLSCCSLYASLYHQWSAVFEATPDHDGGDHFHAAMSGLLDPITAAEAQTLVGHKARGHVLKLIWGNEPPPDDSSESRVMRAIVRDLAAGWPA